MVASTRLRISLLVTLWVTVPTLAGEVSLSLPKGAKSGSKLRLRGKGVPKGENAGDLLPAGASSS